jgi:hypothetical protein
LFNKIFELKSSLSISPLQLMFGLNVDAAADMLTYLNAIAIDGGVGGGGGGGCISNALLVRSAFVFKKNSVM